MEQLGTWWQSWYVQDAIIALALFGLFRMIRAMRRSEYWRAAAREVARRRMAVVSFWILCAYATIAVLDSIGWHPPLRGPDGAVMRSDRGAVVYDPRGLTALDLLLTPLRLSQEKTYSAPLARRQFTQEYVSRPEGGTRPEFPALKHPGRHPLGTDTVGVDILYQTLKGVRTAMILGLLTTLLIVPFAILFGVTAGYYGGWVDDIVQYVYSVLASIPFILLATAFMVLFGRGLGQLCIVMGLASWTGLCRVLRGETLKLREAEFVQAAEALHVSRPRIIRSHIIPNVMHLVVITTVLGFSGRVLSEAALTYIGIGVGAETHSWGRMISTARFELARDPLVWWNLVASFLFMFGLVLPANVFGDAVRDALDPKLRTR